MLSLNKVMLIGHLGADPETRHSQSGSPMTNFRMAVSEQWRDKNSGEKRERTEWFRITIYNEHLSKVADNYLRKGSKVYVEGKLTIREWEDKEGQKRSTPEIVLQGFDGKLIMLDGKGADDSGGGGGGRSDDRSSGRSSGGSSRSGGSGRDDRSSGRDDRGGGGGGSKRSYSRDELDDEIPF